MGRNLRIGLALVLAVAGLARWAYAADEPRPSTAPATEARVLIDILRDDEARTRLIARLEEAAKPLPGSDSNRKGPVEAAEATSPPQTAGEGVLRGGEAMVRAAVLSFRDDWRTIRATARRLEGLAAIRPADAMRVIRELGPLVALSVGLAVIGRRALMPVFRRLGRAAVGLGPFRKAASVLAGIAIHLAVVLAAGAVSLILVGGLGEEAGKLSLRTYYIAGYLVAGALIVAVRAMLSPVAPELRPLPMSDRTAEVWAGRLAIVVIVVTFGELVLPQILTEIATPIVARATTVALYGAALIYLIVLVIVHRKDPARQLERLAAQDDDNAGLAILAAAAPYWHWVALPCLLILLHQAMTSVGPAIPLLIAIVEIGAALAMATLIFVFLSDVANRGVHLPDRLNRALPGVEARLASFVPGFLRALRFVLVLLWIGFVLQVTGLFEIWSLIRSRFGIDMLGVTATLVGILVVGFAIWLLVSGWVDHRLTAHHGRVPTAREQTLLALLRNFTLVALLLLGLAYALLSVGISIAPLLASAGVIGLALSWGSQKLVQDIITGVFIQFENAINVGDVVEAGGKMGTVEKLTIRSLSLRDVEGVFHIIPFSSVDAVSNHMKGFSYHVADVGIAYRGDIDAAKAAMLAAYDDLAADMEWGTKLVGGIEWFGVQELAPSAVILRARLKTRPGEQWGVGRAYTELVKRRFDAEGIEIPYPHLKVWFGADRDGTGSGSVETAGVPLQGRLAARPAKEAPRQSVAADAPTDADDD